MNKKLTVEEVMKYAMSKYEEGGSCIVDAYEDSYILELIEDDGYTLKDFDELIREHCKAWSENRRLY